MSNTSTTVDVDIDIDLMAEAGLAEVLIPLLTESGR